MNKSIPYRLMSGTLIVLLFVIMLSCNSTNSENTFETITIGLNFDITGEAQASGKESNKAAEFFTETINELGGMVIGRKTYMVQTALKDNGLTESGAVAAAKSLITEQNAMAIVGPNSSNLAIPAGEWSNEQNTVLIGPATTNPKVTLNRPYVFRVAFLDSFQGEVLAKFAFDQFKGANACVLYASDSPYPKGLAESFKSEWEILNGTIAADQTFTTGDEDLTPQLKAVRDANCGFLFLPQYANEVPPIIEQAHEIGITAPFLGVMPGPHRVCLKNVAPTAKEPF